MGGEGAKFSKEELDKLKGKLDKLNGDAAGIMQLASTTAPDMKVWGLVGMIPAAIYWKVAGEEALEHLKMMGQALEDNVQRVDSAGKAYKATEDGLAAAMQKIQDKLNDTGMPGY
ncbi:hypothetical protein [Flindersiella endophytica]